MTRWVGFVGLTGLLCTIFLSLAWLSQRLVSETAPAGERTDAGSRPDVGAAFPTPTADDSEPTGSTEATGSTEVTGTAEAVSVDESDPEPETDSREPARTVDSSPSATLSPLALVVNVALTQGLFGAVLLGGVAYFAVPPSALGVPKKFGATLPETVALGVTLGLGLWVASELGTALADALGVAYDETLRGLLAPESARGWVVLLAVVLPVIAGVEELLFRAALIGAVTAGFGTPAWAMALVSSAAFALGHGAQGAAGVVLTGLLGLALAGAFVFTGSLLVVIVAHYVVNAVELVVHEGQGLEWPLGPR